MTTRHAGYVVTLVDDTREDDAILFGEQPLGPAVAYHSAPAVEFFLHGSPEQVLGLWSWAQEQHITCVTVRLGESEGVPRVHWHFFLSPKNAETMRKHLAELGYEDRGPW